MNLEQLVGEKVTLRPFSRLDALFIQKWMADAELRRLIGEVAPFTKEEAELYYEKVQADPNRAWYIIMVRDEGKVIGEAGLLRMFKPWRCTDMSIVIGEKDKWRKGYGSEVGHLLLNYAFDHMGFHRVSIGVVGFNVNALKFWRHLGFKEEGIQRDGYFCDGDYSDFIMMSILEDDYRARLSSHNES